MYSVMLSCYGPSEFVGMPSAQVVTGDRIVYGNSPDLNKQQHFVNNEISNTKYNVFSFIPKTLFEQFRLVEGGGGLLRLGIFVDFQVLVRWLLYCLQPEHEPVLPVDCFPAIN